LKTVGSWQEEDTVEVKVKPSNYSPKNLSFHSSKF